ncbi:unnamed protein product [Brassica rapa subsp. narinosa]
MISPVVARRILPPLGGSANKHRFVFFFLQKNTNKTKEFKALTRPGHISDVPFSASLTTKTSSASVVSAPTKNPRNIKYILP